MILNGNTLVEVLPLKDLYSIYKDHERLRVFANKGRECVICGREGVLLLLTVDKSGGRHIDLYTEDFVLITVDHIVPKKIGKMLGWTRSQRESLSNKQTMCLTCNNKKGHSTETNEEFKERTVRNGYPHKVTGVEIIREMVYNNNIFNRELI